MATAVIEGRQGAEEEVVEEARSSRIIRKLNGKGVSLTIYNI